MKIFYYSCLISDNLLKEIIHQSKGSILPAQSIQKFHRLLTLGFKEYFDLKCISSIPFSNELIKLNKNDFDNEKDYFYTSFVKNKYLRAISNFFSAFSYTLKNKKVDFAIFDYLNFSVSLGGFLASKLLKVPTVIIVTDFPDLLVNSNDSILKKLITKFKYKWLNSFDFYILLTESMNDKINIKKRPYLVMEGLVDSHYRIDKDNNIKENVILYAGGLYEKYGVKKLIDSFLKVDYDTELHLYGNGDLIDYIKNKSEENKRIKFFGEVANHIVVERLPKCKLLINPRPSEMELSKYSFPSKNLEYMLSGTPLLTTKLPGIPIDHYPYVYFIEDESIDGFQKSLEEILSKNENELKFFGETAQKFVLNHKSNLNQGVRLYNFLISNGLHSN
ncbi:glycosyltransferase [Empedobacter stercoris]|uniref:glycosyltransferase n=1 Tax=Empedobacter stercoris TaxID=1628248 RepID=UPI0016625ECE|nr:glycosyltransferase [Empedobacter stercoris]MCA4808833.1 glycosyltransferase [Empedobacter stercoris]QNT15359.1 glycosyltransferase [Empedobacter stercoris]